MKKIILLLSIVLISLTASAQSSTLERIYQDAKRNAEWQVRSQVNRTVNQTINDAMNDIRKDKKAKKQGKTWACPDCGSRNDGNFCPNCGHAKPVELTAWTCPECHRHNDGGLFCKHCGASRNASENVVKIKDGEEKQQAPKELSVSVDNLSTLKNLNLNKQIVTLNPSDL